jgi:hypothetical protein
MSYVVENKIGKYTYLYECEGYREGGKVKGRRKTVGKVDPKTGKRVYKPEYLERMRKAGTPIEDAGTQKMFSEDDIKNSSIREFGLTNLLSVLSNRSGLADSLANALPEFGGVVLTLANHLVASGEPFMHCDEWLQGVEPPANIGTLTSQRISEVLVLISPTERERFYQLWCAMRSETEYLALDITSTSSYSELIGDVEWGYNRDGENLAQVNMCMLMGETSRLPIYETVYAGSLKDVSTLEATLSKFDAVAGGKPIMVVMDKGFYSKKNVDMMISRGTKFVIAMPFSAGFAKRQVDGERKDIDRFGNTIVLGGASIRAVSKSRSWSAGQNVRVHIYYNAVKAVTDREKIYADVARMRDNATSEPEKYVNDERYRKFLIVRKSEGTGYTVNVREEVVEAAYNHAGWLVIISNDVMDAREALRIYRAKDVVEKGFLRLKNSLDVGRLRVHGQNAMRNKVFIGFIALILLSQIHNVMFDKDMYKKWTLKEMLRVLSKQRVQDINDTRVFFPPTKEQKEIFDMFDV